MRKISHIRFFFWFIYNQQSLSDEYLLLSFFRIQSVLRDIKQVKKNCFVELLLMKVLGVVHKYIRTKDFWNKLIATNYTG